MDNKDRAKALTRLLIAFIKQQVKNTLGDEIADELGDLTSETLGRKFDDWLSNKTRQITQAEEKAVACFLKGCPDHELAQWMVSLPLDELPRLQAAIANLPNQLDDHELATALFAEIQDRWETLRSDQINQASDLYLNCLRRALATVPDFQQDVIAKTVLDLRDELRALRKELRERPRIMLKYPPLQLLPPPLNLRGRANELSQLLDDLQPGRIVTLCGPGGIGKTALAAAALHQLCDGGKRPPKDFPNGVIFYTFYNLPSADLALGHIASIFGEETLPTPEAAARRALSGKSALLFLDGAEASDDLEKVLDVRGRCAVLITSRDRSHIFDLYQDLTPLELDSSLSLLRDWGGDQVDDDSQAQRICELIGRLPLAIRLAGRYLAAHKENIAAYSAWLEKTQLAALDHGKRRLKSVPAIQ